MAAIIKVSLADESAFAEISTSTGRPTPSGLTFAKVEFESVEFTVDPVATQRTPTSCSTAESPDAQGFHRDGSGDIYQLCTGTLTLAHYVDQVGGSSDAVTDLTSFRLARTLLVDEGAPPAISSVITTGVSATRITPATAGHWEHGLLAAVEDATTGKRTSTRITGTSAGDKILSPALLAAPANASVARFHRQLYAKSTWSTATVAVRLDGIGFRMTAMGCAASDITWERQRDGRILQTTVLQVADWQADHASADPTCDDLDCSTGRVDVIALHVTTPISSLYCGVGGTLVEPAESARTALEVETWKVSLAVPTTPKLAASNAIGIVGWRRGMPAWTVDLPMCTAQASFFADDRPNKARRQLHLDAGAYGTAEGMTWAFGGVFLKADPQVYERGDDVWRQKLTFGVGDYCGDDDGPPAAAGVDAYAIVGWEV